MDTVIDFSFFVFVRSAIFAAIAAAITARCMHPGPAGLKYGGRFKAALPAWLAAFVVLCLLYYRAWMQGLPPSSVSRLAVLGLPVLGGIAAYWSVKAARLQATKPEEINSIPS